MSHTEVALLALLQVAALLVSHNHDRSATDAGDTALNCPVVRKASVAAHLDIVIAATE
jgi:hypothetical protein